jgi:hypothetical protein
MLHWVQAQAVLVLSSRNLFLFLSCVIEEMEHDTSEATEQGALCTLHCSRQLNGL